MSQFIKFLILLIISLNLKLVSSNSHFAAHIGPGVLHNDIFFKSRRILEHQTSSKCLAIDTQNFQLFLSTCTWDQHKADFPQVLSIIKGNLGGLLFRFSSAPKPFGQEGCLVLNTSTREEEEEEVKKREESDSLYLEDCNHKKLAQTWEFKAANDDKKGEYLIRKFGEDKCLKVFSEEGTLDVAYCNEEDIDQIWRICEDRLDTRQCDA